MNKKNTLVINVLAESPYAEYMGDINTEDCNNDPKHFSKGCLYNLHLN